MGNSTSYTVNIKALFDAGDAQAKIKNIQTTLNNLKLPNNLRSNFNSTFNELNKALEDFQTKSRQGIKSKSDSTAINKSFDRVVAEMEKYDQIVQKIRSQFSDQIDLSNWIKIDDSVKQKLEGIKKEIADFQQQLNNLNASKVEEVKKVIDQIKSKGARGKAEESFQLFNQNDLQGAIKLLDQAIAKQKTLLSFKTNSDGNIVYNFNEQVRQTATTNIQALEKMREVYNEVGQKQQEIQDNIGLKQAEGFQVATQAAQELEGQMKQVADASTEIKGNIEGVEQPLKDATTNAGQFASELDQIKNRIQYFFGLANAINLVKRAVRSSFSTVKELDKAMTETAVVTDYTIKDMWKQLPEYTKRANQLGVTTKEAYESATLYYQQGLNTEQAAALSTETLKMARIAGLDAADATDRMTNALRGFNMELNATQAQRVDDVYSQLAAMSASNVDEISTAMTKVASLANNANMEFETTAAFLAQIIESTRESAETAGTALKTVVARFSEVKKLYDREELKGQDEEGQVIDVNKVSAALRTAGIDLNKYFLGEVGLDDIFIELASKWDSLTNIQQRYIATQAAGSRQQSRFIALMADYKRTQELVGAAYNSTGASEKQFEKTQDSMQSKLARLKNAWDEFAMGLANNAFLKGAVDALTTLLQIINKITSAFGDGAGSILKWVAAISALSGIRKAFMGGGFIDKAVGTFLNGTQLGKTLFKKGTLSGFLFGGKTANGSQAEKEVLEQAVNGGTGTTIRTGGLFNNLFNGNLKKKIADFKKENANLMPQIIEQGIDDTTGRPITDTAFIPSPENTSLFAAFGNKFQKSKIGGAISNIPTHFGGTALSGAATLGVTLGAVAAAAAAAYGAYKLWEHFSPEGQLKQATQFSQAMDQAAESAQKAKESTKQVYDTYTEKDKAVNEATTIAERNKAIEDRNTYVNELLQQNDSYAKYLKTTFKDGQLQLTLDENALKNVADEAEKAETQAAFGADLAKAMQANKQANVYRADIRRAGANIEAGTITNESGQKHAARQMTEKELAKYTNLEIKATERDAVAKGFAKSAFSKMVDGETLGSELGELVTGALTETFDANKYYDTINSSEGGRGWSWLRRRSVWQQKYQEAYGVEADSSMKTADIARAVAQKTAQDQQQDRADTLSELVKSNKEAYEPLLKAISGTFDGKVKLDTDASALIKDLTKGINLEAFADAIGKTPEELKTILESNIKAQKEIYANNIKNLALKGQKAGASRGFFSQLMSMNPDQVADILGFADAAEKSLGDGFTSFLDNLDVSQLDLYKDFFSGFDLDQPLQAVKRLNSAIKDDTNPTIQALATQVKEANKPLFDTGYLTQFFMTSEGYEEISESLEKFIEDNEEITADNIEELAKSCSDLKTLIDETDVNAQGLARAFTAIGKGEGSIEGITSAVLEALGTVKTTTTAIDNLSKSIDDFDAGRDFGKAVDFANEKIDTLRNSLESLDFGNETFKKNYQYFFNDYEKFVKLDTAGRKSLLTQNLDRMEQLLDNDAVGAMRELVDKGIGVSQLDTEGFQFDWKVEGDWDTTVEQVAKALDVNTQIAETIVAAAAKHIPNLLESMDAKGYEQTLNSFAEAARENTVITTQELEILAAATGKTIEQLREDFDKADLKLPVEVNWQDKDGKSLSGDELIKQFRSTEGAIHNIMKDFVGGGSQSGGRVDVDTILNKLQEEYKLSPAQATTIADNIVQSVNGRFTKTVQIPVEIKDENGKGTGEWKIDNVQVSATSVEGLEAQVKLKEDQAQWTAYADAMKTAITQALEIAPNGDASNAIADITTQLSAQTFTVKVKGEYVGTEGAPTGNSLGVTGSDAKGGIVSYASGSQKIKPGVALTGEEGPELVWNKKGGYAYLVGKHGPEFANLVPGDQVFPADETKEIINRGVTPSLAKGGKVVPSYDEGSWNPDGSRKKKKGSGSDSDSSDKDDEFKMDLDKYYNMVEDINELLRLRNLLEKDYNQLLKAEGKTGKEIYDNLNRQLKLLEERSKIVADLAEKRKQQIIDEVAANQEYQKYAWWNNEDLTIEIDWDLVTSITDKDEGGKVKDYLSKLEDFQSKYDDMIEQLEEIEDTIQDIRERGKDQYNTLEERVRDALIKQIQDKIDELQDVDKAINDTNQKLFDSMQETLSMQRQERDNAKTEEELTDKEKRLAYLQQDSSNANALEIAKLQEELANARQSYTDTLIDQKISELQRQNDEAQEQRAQQIELMQRSLDWQERSGAFWETVYQYISEGTDAIGALVKQSELERLLMSAEPWDKLSEEQKLNWVNDLMDQVAQGIAYLELSRQLEDIGTKEGTSISFTNANGQTLTGKADKNGNVVVTNKDGSTITYKDVFQDYHGAYRTFETSGEAKAAPKPAVSTAKPTTTTTTTTTTKPATTTTTTTTKPTTTTNENKEPDGEGWHYSETQHWHQYKGGGKYDIADHKFNDVVNNGDSLTYICTICGYEKRQTITKDKTPKWQADYEAKQKTQADRILAQVQAEEEKKKRGYGPNPGGCFVAGTKVIMANYIEKNIEDIKINDYVFAYNECLKIFEPKKVTKSYVHYNTPFIMTLILSNSLIIKMTPGHPILTATGWKSMDIENSLYEHGVIVKELQINDEIIGYGNNVFVKDIIIKENVDNINVYNIEVEDLHTFIANKIVVHNRKMNAYASGGLNTQTGLAWLDGTTSSPELVLNARDTQNFIELKDVLADMRKGGNFSLNGGDNYYDIKVQVDSLGSDYDVDRAIDRIKARIAQDGAYRNVNTLSRLR